MKKLLALSLVILGLWVFFPEESLKLTSVFTERSKSLFASVSQNWEDMTLEERMAQLKKKTEEFSDETKAKKELGKERLAEFKEKAAEAKRAFEEAQEAIEEFKRATDALQGVING